MFDRYEIFPQSTNIIKSFKNEYLGQFFIEKIYNKYVAFYLKTHFEFRAFSSPKIVFKFTSIFYRYY